MGSDVLASRQGVFTGAGAAVEIQEPGVDWKSFELFDETDTIIYKKTKMDPGKTATVIQNDDTAQISRADAITLDGDKVTIEASVAASGNVFRWLGLVG